MISPTIEGIVVAGDKYGRTLGFPTANLDSKQYKKDKMNLPLGVYAGVAYLAHTGKIHKSAIVIGPLDKKSVPKIEAHILGFSGRLYGKKVILYVYNFLRPYAHFATKQLLIKQIKKDVARVKKEIATPIL